MEDLVTAPTSLDKRWLTEAVRLREEHAGPLEDQEANRRARQLGGDLAARIETRAMGNGRSTYSGPWAACSG